MTPDTAEFPNNITWPVREWTEDEDCIIETVRPPSALSYHSTRTTTESILSIWPNPHVPLANNILLASSPHPS